MIRLAKRLYDDERVRFLAIGVINTVVGYLFFALFNQVLGQWIGYLGSLLLSFACATIIAFNLHRNVTFRIPKGGSVMLDFWRFQSVYILSLGINIVALPLLVEVVKLHPLIAQAIIVTVTTTISYVGHKWFSFRRPATAPVATPEQTDEQLRDAE